MNDMAGIGKHSCTENDFHATGCGNPEPWDDDKKDYKIICIKTMETFCPWVRLACMCKMFQQPIKLYKMH